MLTQRQLTGRRAEEVAAQFLRAQGCAILERNFRRRLGELDLIVRAGNALVIAEVRTRAASRYGSAAESVDRRKQRRIVRAAQLLLQRHPELACLPVRFDVLVVTDPSGPAPRVDWIRHAFECG